MDIANIPNPSNLDIMLMSRNTMFDYDSLGNMIKEFLPSYWTHQIDLNLHFRQNRSMAVSNEVKTVTNNDNNDSGKSNADIGNATWQDSDTGNYTNNNNTNKGIDNLNDGTIGSVSPNKEFKQVSIADVDVTMNSTSVSVPISNSLTSSVHYMIPMTIPLYRSKDEIGSNSLLDLCTLFGESTMKIYNAILLKKRVLFVGYNHSAEDVGKMVLAASALVTPIITGIIQRFDYVCVCVCVYVGSKYICISVCINIYLCICEYMYTYCHVCMYLCGINSPKSFVHSCLLFMIIVYIGYILMQI